ncbi:hypothetical protein NC652_018774 [Populus alba x Populus x berolinensis]|nr:hypothetical protein NC652_018774 [Populus alba x Populus x berolinensis]
MLAFAHGLLDALGEGSDGIQTGWCPLNSDITDQTYLGKNLTDFQEGVTNANMFSYSSISLCIEPTIHALDRLHLSYSFFPERIAQFKHRLPMIEASF